MSALAAHAAAEVRMTLRRGESLVLTIAIPVLLLVFFSLVDVLPTGEADAVEFLAPGILALAVMSTAFTGLAIATGFERSYGVLKRLGTTPLSRPQLLAAKTTAVLTVEALQVAVLVTVAIALGWDASPAVLPAAGLVALATVAFAGLGLLMAGTLPALTTLAAANGLYVVLLLLGDMVIPLAELPAALRTVAELMPSAALADGLRSAFAGTAVSGTTWLVLTAWAIFAPLAAAATFKWE